MAKNYERMIRPSDGKTVDIPLDLVKEKIQDGYVIDTRPDTRPEIQTKLPGFHKGRVAFVAGCGPSMAVHRPDRILGLIRELDAVVYATNYAWKVLGGAPLPSDYLVMMDDSLYTTHFKDVTAYLKTYPSCLLCCPFHIHEAIHYHEMRIEMNQDPDPPYVPGQYFHGLSSGVAAVQMAMQAGCETIYLLGHDLTVANRPPDEHGKINPKANLTHGFGTRSSEEAVGLYPQGKYMVQGYKILRRHADRIGVRIVNLSQLSVLDCFDRERIE